MSHLYGKPEIDYLWVSLYWNDLSIGKLKSCPVLSDNEINGSVSVFLSRKRIELS